MFISSPCQKIGVLNVGVMPSESKSYVVISREIQSQEIKFMSDATRENLRGAMCEAGRGQVDTPKYLPHCTEVLDVDVIRVLL